MIIFLFFINFLFAQEHCESLSTLSCAPREVNDGTGAVPAASEIKRSQEQLKEKANKIYTNEFLKMLENSDNEHFRDMAMESFNLKSTPGCKMPTTKAIAQCNKNIAEGLVA